MPKTEIPDNAYPYGSAYKHYLKAGWHGVLPVGRLKKAHPPRGFTGTHAQTPTVEQCEGWASEDPTSNIVLRLPDGVIGIDVDQYVKAGVQKVGAETLAAFEAQHGKLPATWSSTRRDADGPSRIYFFRVPKGLKFPQELGPDVEIVQHTHRYAVVWPSVVHEDDKNDTGALLGYEWFDNDLTSQPRCPRITELAELPEAQVKALLAIEGARPRGTESLAELLAVPSNSPRRGNDYVTEIAGHLARTFKDEQQFLFAVLHLYRSTTDDPDPRAEDAARSVWRKEQSKPKDPGDAGWLEAGLNGYTIWSTVSNQQWGDFNVVVKGVIPGDDSRQFDVVLRRNRQADEVAALLASDTVLSPQGLKAWLGRRGCTIAPPALDSLPDNLGRVSDGVRLLRYMEAQNAPESRVVGYLGWDAKSKTFITTDGVILGEPGESAVSPFRGVRPNPKIKESGLITCNYGFEGTKSEAMRVLGEVMHFHEPQFAAVMGAFMTASVLKGQLDYMTDVWPYPLIESPSGSGKSNGFMPMIQQLMGRVGRSSTYSPAALRDALGAHRCLPEWIDDPDDVEPLKKLLRLCSSKGSETRRGGANWDRQDKTVFVSVPIVSAEALGLLDQKAYADRSIALNPGKPNHRRSRHNPENPQIDDIRDLEQQYEGELSAVAGWVVSAILQRRGLVTASRFRKYKEGHSGRHADKMAILQMGAFVLADVLGPDFAWIVAEVDQWAASQEYNELDNRLTTTIVRQFLIQHGAIEQPHWMNNQEIVTPVICTPDADGHRALWVNIEALAIWWNKERRGRIEARTDTKDALAAQARQMDMKGNGAGKKNIDFKRTEYQGLKVVGDRPQMSRRAAVFQRIPDAAAVKLMELAPGVAAPTQ